MKKWLKTMAWAAAAGAVLAGIVALVLAGAAVYARARTRHRSRSQSS